MPSRIVSEYIATDHKAMMIEWEVYDREILLIDCGIDRD